MAIAQDDFVEAEITVLEPISNEDKVVQKIRMPRPSKIQIPVASIPPPKSQGYSLGAISSSPKRATMIGSPKNKSGSKVITCPRCKVPLENAQAMGKHAIACFVHKGVPQDTPTIANDKLEQIMKEKRLKRQKETEEAEMKQKEKAQKDQELQIRIEKIRIEKEKIEQENQQKQDEEQRLKLERFEQQEKIKKEKALEIENQLQERAQLFLGDNSDTESDDEETIARRKRLKDKLDKNPVIAVCKKDQPDKKNVSPGSTTGLKPREHDSGCDDRNSISKDDSNLNSKDERKLSSKDDGELSSKEEPNDIEWVECPYEGYTAAHFACYANDSHYLSQVIRLGGDLVSYDPDGRNPLIICAIYHHNECLQLLVEHLSLEKILEGDAQGKCALSLASGYGNFNGIAILYGACPSAIQVCDMNGDFALHEACKYGFVDCVSILLQLGADVDGPRNNEGKTPAQLCTSLPILQVLIDYSADYYAIDNKNRSLLFTACATNRCDIAQYILDIDSYAYCICLQDLRGDTPLHAACCLGHEDVVKLLLSKGADPFVQNLAQLTPIGLAEMNEQFSCIDVLQQFSYDRTETPDEVWMKYIDEQSEMPYYWNSATGQTQWELPEKCINKEF